MCTTYGGENERVCMIPYGFSKLIWKLHCRLISRLALIRKLFAHS